MYVFFIYMDIFSKNYFLKGLQRNQSKRGRIKTKSVTKL